MASDQTSPDNSIMPPQQTPPNTVLQNRVAGVAIAAASLASIFLMLHHPRPSGAVDPESFGQATRHLHGLDPVHASFIAIIGILVFGFMGFADQLGPRKPLVRAGLIAYLIGAFAMLNALMASTISANPNFAVTAVIATSVAMLLWSVALMHRRGAPRLVGTFGLLTSAGPGVMLLVHGALGAGVAAGSGAIIAHMPLNVVGMTVVVVIQSIWNLVIATMLLRSRL